MNSIVELTPAKADPYQVTIDGELYSLNQTPDPQSALVQNCRKEILHDMDLEEVYENLNRTAGLMFLAYVSVAGADSGKIQAKISGLQTDLLELCSKCIVAMTDFERQSGNVVESLLDTFDWLLQGEESIAVKKLTKCEQYAAKMAEQSEILAGEFEAISKDTEGAKQDTIREQGMQEDKRILFEKQVAEALSQKKLAEESQQRLAEAVKNMNELYEDARKREEKAADRAMITAIVSSLGNAISAGLGAYNGAKGSMEQSSASSDLTTTQDELEKAKKDAEKAKIAANKAKEQVTLSQEKLDKLDKLSDGIKEKQKIAKDTTTKADSELAKAEEKAKASSDKEVQKAVEVAKTTAEEAQKKLIEAELTVSDHQKKIKKAKEQLEKDNKNEQETAAQLQGAQASIQSLSDALKQISDNAQNEMESLHQEKMKYLDEKLKLEEQKRETLNSMVKFAEEVKNAQFEQNNAETAVYSLSMAIKALAQVVISLNSMSLFWRSMEGYCQDLTTSKFKENINDVKDDLDLDERLAYYQRDRFKLTSIDYLGRWKALQVVCGEYLTASQKTREKVVLNIKAAPSITESKVLVPQLANQVLADATMALKQNNAGLELITNEQKTLKKVG